MTRANCLNSSQYDAESGDLELSSAEDSEKGVHLQFCRDRNVLKLYPWRMVLKKFYRNGRDI